MILWGRLNFPRGSPRTLHRSNDYYHICSLVVFHHTLTSAPEACRRWFELYIGPLQMEGAKSAVPDRFSNSQMGSRENALTAPSPAVPRRNTGMTRLEMARARNRLRRVTQCGRGEAFPAITHNASVRRTCTTWRAHIALRLQREFVIVRLISREVTVVFFVRRKRRLGGSEWSE